MRRQDTYSNKEERINIAADLTVSIQTGMAPLHRYLTWHYNPITLHGLFT